MDTLLIVFVTAAVLLPVLIYQYRRRNEATVTLGCRDAVSRPAVRGRDGDVTDTFGEGVHDDVVADNQREVADNG